MPTALESVLRRKRYFIMFLTDGEKPDCLWAMKIVINNCFGGFSLSPTAIKRWSDLKGHGCFFFNWCNFPLSLEEAERSHSFLACKTDVFDDYNNGGRIASCKLDRADPDLVKIVEEMGDAASGNYSMLKVVEIPDGVDWEIMEYDGAETIHEKHRSWN